MKKHDVMINFIGWIVDRKRNKEFDEGKKAGYEEGLKAGMAMNFERSEELSKEEYDHVMKYLIDHGLELCCYDVHKGGFRIRKRKYLNR